MYIPSIDENLPVVRSVPLVVGIVLAVDIAIDRILVVGITVLLAELPFCDVEIFEAVVTDECAVVCAVGSESR